MIKQKRLNNEQISIRSESESGGQIIEGWASVFNKRSRLIAEQGKVFYEVINPNAFDGLLEDEKLNVIANFQHDNKNMLARSKSNTLNLSIEDYGLKYSFVAPNTSLGRDIIEWLNRGDITESSFRYSFNPNDVVWSRAEDGIPIREILVVKKLMDIALVINGAFADTDVALRELAEFEAQEEVERQEKELKREQELAQYYTNLKTEFYGVN